jgi:hypothetical protein
MVNDGPFAHLGREPRSHEPDPLSEPGTLPPVFQFSQQSLQDYVDCARRFQLKYVLGQRWPAIEQEPVEEREDFLERGSQFHLLVQRHLMGIPIEKLTPQDEQLKRWWDAYLDYPLLDLPTTHLYPEIMLSTPVGDQRLLAKFDLLAIDPGERMVIVDWKTSQKRPDRQRLARRLQTRVYPFVAVEAGKQLFGGTVEPEQISLIYWFAEAPLKPEIFTYTFDQHEENRTYLSDLIQEVLNRGDAEWPLTGNRQFCHYCIYRSLCDRGVQAGRMGEIDIENDVVSFDFEFDLDQIDEIAF